LQIRDRFPTRGDVGAQLFDFVLGAHRNLLEIAPSPRANQSPPVRALRAAPFDSGRAESWLKVLRAAHVGHRDGTVTQACDAGSVPTDGEYRNIGSSSLRSTRKFLPNLFRKNAERAIVGGVAAKWRYGSYQTAGRTSWLKIKNPEYSQAEDRHELFEKRRRAEGDGRWRRRP
jgi:hypothetical protein